MVHSSAPGKLMISGEWAVLDVGNPCIVAAVNKRVHCEITEGSDIFIEVKNLGLSSKGTYKDGEIILEYDDPPPDPVIPVEEPESEPQQGCLAPSASSGELVCQIPCPDPSYAARVCP